MIVKISLLFISSLILAGCTVSAPTLPRSNSSQTTPESESTLPDFSLDPFYSLTIPYLQSRDYTSQLGELTTYQQTPTHTKFLTSYDSDGLNINGLLTIPTGQMPAEGWPAVVFIHGYIPPNQYQTTQRYQSYVDYLASRGLVVFKIDLRGHGESEGDASGAYYSGDYIIDTLNAKAALADFDQVDSSKISLWGHSMAGNVVLRSLVADPDIHAGVIWAGAVFTYQDFGEYGISDSSYQRPSTDSPRQQRRDELFDRHGRFSSESEFWQQVAPTNFLSENMGNIQIHHAVNDPTVSVEYARNLSKVLDENEIEHEYYEYTSGGHDIEGTNFVVGMERALTITN